ncbi:hypothetical protein ACWCQ1_51340 [Streptomyces sp. NPDC002144]|uniref:hypothetical protein n=1 Tax=Bacilli TaxID=91061 RepID=UPI00203A70DE|nr:MULTISPECIES: hypothetical protein [Bacilli]MCM3032959.1 hypothetical protein [Niallia sp. MER 6]MDK8746833.1 hypothetical protein [Streptococcus agalactiae]
MIIELVFKIIGYSLFVYGLWLLVGVPFLSDYIETEIKKLKRKRAIKRLKDLNNTEYEDESHSKLYEHIELTLSSLQKKHGRNQVFNFFFLTCIIFVVSFIFLFVFLQELIVALLLSVIFAIIPYLLMRFLLINLRIRTSIAFYEMSNVLLQNYQVSNRDIYYTVFNTSKETKNNTMKKILMKLLSALQKERTEEEFKKAVKIFAYTINSTPAKRFSKLLEKAHLENADISISLRSLQDDIKKRKQDMEKEKTDKMETVFMGYLPIVMLPICFYMMMQFSSGRDVWYYFFQKTPITLFAICLVMAISSALTAFLLSKPRSDL